MVQVHTRGLLRDVDKALSVAVAGGACMNTFKTKERVGTTTGMNVAL